MPRETTDAALRALMMHAIATGDQTNAVQLLAVSPELASARLEEGATRQLATPLFLNEIKHVVYTGDTALHIAAAAYRPAIVQDLLARGADTA